MPVSCRHLALIPLLALGLAGAADEAAVPVLANKEVTLKGRKDADVQTRELWYARSDGKVWGAFQKHGLSFGRDTPIVWAPPEGHWRTYVRVIEVNNNAMPEPTPATDAKLCTEFIIDRSAPKGQIDFPTAKAKLRGGQRYTLKWTVSDPNLAANPITLQWSRGGDGKFEMIAEKLANTGTYDWEVPKDMTQTGVLRLIGVDKAGNAGAADVSALLVDSAAPNGRVVGPAISAAPEVNLQLAVTDAGPAGLSKVQVWTSRDDGQTWAEGPVAEAPFKTVAWKASGDGRFRLAVLAVDQAGNPSPTPKGKADGQFSLLIDSQKPVIQLVTANGVSEAEGGKVRTSFKPGDRVQVAFAVTDVQLAENPVSIFISTEPGTWTELATAQPADSAFRFAIPAKDSRQARIKVTAVDVAGNVGEVVAAESFVIDTQVEASDTGFDSK